MITPYKAWAAIYLSLGWSPLPFPLQAKHPAVDHRAGGCKCAPGVRGEDGRGCLSYTGGEGRYADATDVQAWTGPRSTARSGKMTFPPGNVGLRLPKTVLGIDVDTYGSKAGAVTLAAAEKAWGALPATWVAANRPATPLSGIRLFSLPDGAWELDWPGDLGGFHGKGVELIRWDHRYVIAAPSIHDEGRVYFWRMPDGTVVDLSLLDLAGPEVELDLPSPSELVALPDNWINGLTHGRRMRSARGAPGAGGGSADLTVAEVRAWIEERETTVGPDLCAVMDKTLVRYLREVRGAGDDGGAHDVARDGAWALIGDAAAGHAGLSEALARLRSAFMTAVEGRRVERIASGEWERIVVRGISKLAREGEPEDTDRCVVSAVTGVSARAGRGGAGYRRAERGGVFDYPRDDRGNARRLYNALGKGADVRWCAPLGGWFVWDPDAGRWRGDPEGLLLQAIFHDIVDDMVMEVETAEIESEAARAALLRFAAGSGNAGRIAAALTTLRALPGVAVEASVFDTNPRLLLCPNGVVELSPGGPAFRPSGRDDYLTLSTGTRYLADADVAMTDDGVNAGAALWEGFLGACLPDVALRTWVQAAVGYSLLGANPERLLFICEGPTSTGKSTFVEAIRAAVGEHGGAFNFSLFRSEREQGPNVALVRLLPKRFIVASEASQERHLHADEVKRLTGNETIPGRLNNANEMIERVPAFTPWIATNAAPTINGADMALYKRLVVVPFESVVAESSEDVDLGERLRTESRSAILAWAVRGWCLYVGMRAVGGSIRNLPEAASVATLKMRGELSDFAVWLTSRTRPADFEHITSTDDLYADWEMWCNMNNVKPGSRVEFGRGLSRNGYQQGRGYKSGGRFYGWRGLKLVGP